MAKLNRTCGICRKKYSYCPSCAADANKPTWLAIFCCENCRDLYNVINDYRYKSLSKEDALKKLNILDLSCRGELPENFKQTLDEIFYKECNIEEITEEPIKQEEHTIKNEDVVEERKPKSRKRNYTKRTTVINELIEDK